MDNPCYLDLRHRADWLSASRSIDSIDCAHELWPTLAPLETMYPGFSLWYWGKVVPGLKTGERAILLDGDASDPRGLAIAKRNREELKVCTLWVAQSQRGRGLGRRLLGEAIEWVGVDRPLFTVPAERYEELLPLTREFGFEETAQVESLYRPGVVEHVFNGSQNPRLSS